jgi:hypothetical protein
MVTNFERWRMIYGGVTAYQDGPALANQGTVAACQSAFEPQVFSATANFKNGTNYASAASCYSTVRPLVQYQPSDLPDYNKTQSMPNAYFSESKNGCYLPLRLGANHQRWRSEKEVMNFVSTMDVRSAPANFASVPWLASTGANVESVVFPAQSNDSVSYWWPDMGVHYARIQTYGGAPTDMFMGHPPHPNVESFTWRLNGDLTTSVVQGPSTGCQLLPQLTENVGIMCFRNLAVTTGIQAYFRVGIEAQCKVGSLYSPFLKIAPEYDPLAVEMYYKISRELKDAYPADYNDLGKLWEVIKNAARIVTGGLSFVPGPVGAIAGIVHRVIAPGGIEMKVGANVAPRDSPPAAALERVQDQVRGRSQPVPKLRKKKVRVAKRPSRKPKRS